MRALLIRFACYAASPTKDTRVHHPSNFLVAGGGGARNLQRQSEGRAADMSTATMKDLKAANCALAKELVREKGEHEQDIADAHGTIQHLQEALSSSHTKLVRCTACTTSLWRCCSDDTTPLALCRAMCTRLLAIERLKLLAPVVEPDRLHSLQGELETATRSKLEDAAHVIEELRTQLNEEQVLRRGEHSHHEQLASSNRELETQMADLQGKLEGKEKEAGTLGQRCNEAADQLSAMQQALSSANSRCVISRLQQHLRQGALICTANCSDLRQVHLMQVSYLLCSPYCCPSTLNLQGQRDCGKLGASSHRRAPSTPGG